jgi:hypothetical protein
MTYRTVNAVGTAFTANGPACRTGTAFSRPDVPEGALHESAQTKPHP